MRCRHCTEVIVSGRYLPTSKSESWWHARTRQFTCDAIRRNYTGKGWPVAKGA